MIEIEKFFPHINVSQEACPMWVSLVENNEYQSPGADYFVKNICDHLLQKDSQIDTILLACTHYPLLMDKIKQYTARRHHIDSPGHKIVADSLTDYLERHPAMAGNISKTGKRQFYTTGETADFNSHASLFLAVKIQCKKLHFALKTGLF
jgi:glutamate racemase